MKKLLIVTILIVFTFISRAQLKIEGTVYDAVSKQPLIGANIRILQTFSGLTTDQNGTFSFHYLKTGEYKIEVSYLGYETVEKTFQLNENINTKIYLNPKAILNDEVVIISTRSNKLTPSTFQNIDKVEIGKINLGQDLPQLMDQSVSAVTTSDAGTGIGYTGIRIRGTDMTRINVTINGVPVNDAESQSVFWVDLPDLASSVENIQIQRGVGTTSNGAAAFGASINILTNGLKEKPYTQLDQSFGSFKTSKTTITAGTGLIGNRFTFDVRLSKINSDGYIDRAFSKLNSINLSGAWYSNKSILRFIYFGGNEITYQAWNGVPSYIIDTNRTYNAFTYLNQTDNYLQDNYQLIFSREISKSFSLNTVLHMTKGKGYYEEFQDINNPYAATSFSYYGLPDAIHNQDTIINSDIIRQKWLDNMFYGITYSLNYSKNKFNAILGGNWNQYNGDHYGEIIWAKYAYEIPKDYRWYENTGIKKELSLYTKLSYQRIKPFYLFADIQFRNINYTIKGTEDGFGNIDLNPPVYNFLNPKAGISYSFKKDNKAYLSFAISNREPNRNNYVDASNSLQKPQPETLYDFEAGLEHISKSLLLNANIYYMNYKNQLVNTGEINNVGYPIARNIPKSFRTGIELIASLKISKKVKCDANLSISKNKIIGYNELIDEFDANWIWLGQKNNFFGNTDLSFSPSIIFAGKIAYQPINNLSINIFTKYIGRQYIDNTSNIDRSLTPYFINNLQVDYALQSEKFKDVIFSLLINNIFNQEYESNGWIYSYYYDGIYSSDIGYYPQAGINFMGGIKIKI